MKQINDSACGLWLARLTGEDALFHQLLRAWTRLQSGPKLVLRLFKGLVSIDRTRRLTCKHVPRAALSSNQLERPVSWAQRWGLHIHTHSSALMSYILPVANVLFRIFLSTKSLLSGRRLNFLSRFFA